MPFATPDKACQPLLARTKILRRSHNQVARELAEAFYIDKSGDECVSDPSINLYKKERTFLACALRQ